MAVDVKKIVGAKVVALRNELSLNQQDVADYIGKSRVYLCGIEKGKYNLTLETIWRLCNALSCTPNDLFPPQKKIRYKKVTKNVRQTILVKVTKQRLPTKRRKDRNDERSVATDAK